MREITGTFHRGNSYFTVYCAGCGRTWETATKGRATLAQVRISYCNYCRQERTTVVEPYPDDWRGKPEEV
jgi:NAD-dependent SIR2 family protein deacetylase